MIETMGSDAYDASLRGDSALLEHVRGGGTVGGASDEERAAMERGGPEGRRAAAAYRARMARQGAASAGGLSVTTASGRSQLGDEGGLGAIIDDLSAGSMEGGMPGAEEGGGGTGEGGQFAHAVGVFTRASENLLQASENFQQSAEISSIAGIAQSAVNPFGILSGIFTPPFAPR